jgi:hypothetical protein
MTLHRANAGLQFFPAIFGLLACWLGAAVVSSGRGGEVFIGCGLAALGIMLVGVAIWGWHANRRIEFDRASRAIVIYEWAGWPWRRDRPAVKLPIEQLVALDVVDYQPNVSVDGVSVNPHALWASTARHTTTLVHGHHGLVRAVASRIASIPGLPTAPNFDAVRIPTEYGAWIDVKRPLRASTPARAWLVLQALVGISRAA